MKRLQDDAVARLRDIVRLPDVGDRYELQELIGRGGMGVVYRAYDRVLQRDVAIKVATLLADDVDTARVMREARILAQLEHPGIVAVHDAGETLDGTPWYAMRLVRGVRLDQWVVDRSRGERLRLFLQICDAVGFAHARAVIHRDIKPGNIMIGEFGEVLLLDWGIAKVGGSSAERMRLIATNTTGTQDGVVVGTPGYMAPEQVAGSSTTTDGRADIYALGVLLRTLVEEPAHDVPKALAAIARRASANEPDQRYPHVTALSEDIRHWLDGEPVTAYREQWWERLQRLYLRNQAIVLLFLMYAVVRLVILWWRGV